MNDGVTLLNESVQAAPGVIHGHEVPALPAAPPQVIRAEYREIRFLLDARGGGIIVYVLVTYGDGVSPGSWHCKTFADDLTVEDIARQHICECWLWPSCARPR